MITLSIGQILRTLLMQKNCFIILDAVGSASGASKTSCDGLKAVGQKPQDIAVFDETCPECINFYRDIDTYLRIRSYPDPASDLFFLSMNHHARDVRQFWKRQPLGKNSILRIFLDC